MSAGESEFAVRETALVGSLRALADPQARFAWVMEHGARRSGLSADERRTEYEVKGCASRLWLSRTREGGRCRFRCDSESAILKAFVGLFCELYDGLSPEEVATCEPEVLEVTALARQLSENRRRTLRHVRELMREFARAGAAG